jgi:uncharacterized protein YebE (UPF0316 family)
LGGEIGVVLNFTLIFLSRVVDVSLGTVRIMLISKGMRLQASILGFFEVLIWIVVVAQVLTYISSPIYYVAFAGGFASGNYIGMLIEQRLALGNVLVRIITRVEADKLVSKLREENFIITSLDAEGRDGPVKVIFGITKRKNLKQFIKIVNTYNPNAFYTIEDIREIRQYKNDPIFAAKKDFFLTLKRK